LLAAMTTCGGLFDIFEYPPNSSSPLVDAVLQFNGGELVLQILQTACPIKLEAALGRRRGFRRRRFRQKLNKRLHLPLRRDGQGFIFGDQRTFAHNACSLPKAGHFRNPSIVTSPFYNGAPLRPPKRWGETLSSRDIFPRNRVTARRSVKGSNYSFVRFTAGSVVFATGE